MSETRSTVDESQSLFLQIVLIGGFIFICLVLFALARSIYRDSFQVGGYITTLEKGIGTEQTAKQSAQSELAYAQTPQYQEKVAKELLGKKLPGEDVIILTHEEQNIDDLLPEDLKRARDEMATLTNPEKWLKYVFGI